MLQLKSRSGPNITPAPFGNQFLAGTRKVAGSLGQGSIHVRVADDGSAEFYTLFEEGFVEVVKLGVLGHGVVSEDWKMERD